MARRVLIMVLVAWVAQLPGPAMSQGCKWPDQPWNCYPCDKKKMAHLYSEMYCTEEKVIDQNPQLFSRRGSELVIRASNSVTRTFKDKYDPDAPTQRGAPGYTLVEFLPNVGYAAIHVDYYEGFSYLFVNLQTGDVVDLDGTPSLSPNGSFLAVSRSDVVFNTDAKLAVYAVGPDRLVKEFDTSHTGYTHGLERISKTLGNWGPRSIQWVSDTEFSFVAEPLDCQLKKCVSGKPPTKYSFSRQKIRGKEQWWLQ